MNILGVGPLELLILAVIALLVLGPKGMTDLGRKTGRLIRRITRSSIWQDIVSTSRDINDLPRKIMQETDLEKEMNELRASATLENHPEKINPKSDPNKTGK